MTLIWLCSAWLVGIVAADWLGLPAMPSALLAGSAALLAPLWRRSPAYMPLVLLAALALGTTRMAAARPTTDATAVWSYANTRGALTGSIAQQPVWRDDEQVVILAAEQLTAGDASRTVHGLVRLRIAPAPELSYGQRIVATGVLKRPHTGRSFDFRRYLERHSIYAIMEEPRVEVQGEARGLGPLFPLLRLNAYVRDKMLRLLPEPHAALLAGMLLGTHMSIPRTVLQDFRGTGTSHLLVISGWNITVLAGTLVGVFVALGVTRREGAVLTLPVLLA